MCIGAARNVEKPSVEERGGSIVTRRKISEKVSINIGPK